jgi:hypothetical protein
MAIKRLTSLNIHVLAPLSVLTKAITDATALASTRMAVSRSKAQVKRSINHPSIMWILSPIFSQGTNGISNSVADTAESVGETRIADIPIGVIQGFLFFS